MRSALSSMPWWGWAGLVVVSVVFGGGLVCVALSAWWAPMGNDVDIPDRDPMESDGSLYGTNERRPS